MPPKENTKHGFYGLSGLTRIFVICMRQIRENPLNPCQSVFSI